VSLSASAQGEGGEGPHQARLAPPACCRRASQATLAALPAALPPAPPRSLNDAMNSQALAASSPQRQAGMGDVLLSMLAPPLARVLEVRDTRRSQWPARRGSQALTAGRRSQVSFLSGFVVSWRLQTAGRPPPGAAVPRLPRRRRLALTPRGMRRVSPCCA